MPREPLDLAFEQPSCVRRFAFTRWLEDWQDDPYDPYRRLFARAWVDFDWYVALCDRMRNDGFPPKLSVPLDIRWALSNNELVGELYLFYDPLDGDNHIGYKVRPSYRRRGVGTALLRYGIECLKERGIATARLTCGDTNLASAALLERAGGTRLEDKRGREGQLLRRYALPVS